MEAAIQEVCGFAGCEVVELNVQADHVHLVVMIPPKVSISELLGRLKGQTSIGMFHQFRYLKKKPYWGNHFWAKGYCVDTVGLDADMIRKYVRYQEKKEQQREQLQLIDSTCTGGTTHTGPPPLGVGPGPSYGGFFKAAPCGCGFFTGEVRTPAVQAGLATKQLMFREIFSSKALFLEQRNAALASIDSLLLTVDRPQLPMAAATLDGRNTERTSGYCTSEPNASCRRRRLACFE